MEEPLAWFGLGEPVTLEIVDDTAFPHTLHLHGMHFREIARDNTVAQCGIPR